MLTLQGRVLRMRHRFEPGDDAAARLDAAVREVAEHARQRGAGSLEPAGGRRGPAEVDAPGAAPRRLARAAAPDGTHEWRLRVVLS
ncbi:hypothetical protein GCM10025868_46280 [Angustibacter aerolatus]|uniref:Uncharacterized protein n=1 Tax=Angustibacter aerolatus TaxID=1162965 RepID=A0ABQ6JMW4_9ACTN|nr:hypothetical protein [Angustibacter aerolatus]GMA89378.1 hypothetical protein GCM10025868_46280 [Angustibacter aerolatus]